MALAVTSTEHILINTEGRVHRNTFLQQRNNSTRQRMVSEKKVGRKWRGRVHANYCQVLGLGFSFHSHVKQGGWVVGGLHIVT